MAEHSSLNDIFARLDQSKANRAEEENRKRKLEAEAAEQKHREKAAAESAVEKYHVFDDNYDVEDVEDEPIVMIPQNNPSAPEAKTSASVQQPVTKQDMDEISDGNPFVQNLFKRPHKQAKLPNQKRQPKQSGFVQNAFAAKPVAQPEEQPAFANPVPETTTVIERVQPAAQETVDTVDTVDEPSIEIDMTDIEDVEPAAPIPTPTTEPMPEQPEEDFSTPLVPPVQEEAAEPITTISEEPQSGSEEVSGPAGALVQQQDTDEMQWPVGMKGPQFTESLVAYGESPRKAETEEANVFLYARYNDETGIGSYGLCVDMGDSFVQSSRSGHAPNEEEFALMGAIEMFNAIKERDIHDVVVYTEPELAKAMNENANRLINGKSEVCRKYIDLAWNAMMSVSIRFVTTGVKSEFAQLALATAKYLAFREEA